MKYKTTLLLNISFSIDVGSTHISSGDTQVPITLVYENHMEYSRAFTEKTKEIRLPILEACKEAMRDCPKGMILTFTNVTTLHSFTTECY